jgi:hypothetical protein
MNLNLPEQVIQIELQGTQVWFEIVPVYGHPSMHDSPRIISW